MDSMVPPVAGSPAPPLKTGTLRWVLIGCGCLGFLAAAGAAGCGALAWFALRAAGDAVGPVGEAYLRGNPEIAEQLGEITAVERKTFDMRIKVEGSSGGARLGYRVETARGRGDATVWFRRTNDRWQAVGAVVDLDGETVEVGRRMVLDD